MEAKAKHGTPQTHALHLHPDGLQIYSEVRVGRMKRHANVGYTFHPPAVRSVVSGIRHRRRLNQKIQENFLRFGPRARSVGWALVEEWNAWVLDSGPDRVSCVVGRGRSRHYWVACGDQQDLARTLGASASAARRRAWAGRSARGSGRRERRKAARAPLLYTHLLGSKV
eukprot:scaffold110205_cov31-Tisochrysis_lutea.AAC.3